MKIGLVLGGGGAKGSYQIGVLKALMEHDIHNKIDYVSGTSIGAMNALMLMSGMTNEEMVKLWNKIDNKKIYKDGFGRYRDDLKGIFSINEVYDLLVENQDIEMIRNSKIQGYAAIANVPNDKFLNQINIPNIKLEMAHLNSAEDPFKVALASASIPIVFGPTKIDDSYYVDGGIRDGFPVQSLIDQSCDVLITVSLYSITKIKKFKDKASIIDISPRKPLGFIGLSSLNFSEKSAIKYFKLGYNNAIQILNYINEIELLNDIEERKVDKHFFINLAKVKKYEREKKNEN